jgi:hypothetical protein
MFFIYFQLTIITQSMVVTRHIGRLGNNMFQIAASIGYARKYGYEWRADSGSGVSDPYSSIHQHFLIFQKKTLEAVTDTTNTQTNNVKYMGRILTIVILIIILFLILAPMFL